MADLPLLDSVAVMYRFLDTLDSLHIHFICPGSGIRGVYGLTEPLRHSPKGPPNGRALRYAVHGAETPAVYL
jgi:hypothetical protein